MSALDPVWSPREIRRDIAGNIIGPEGERSALYPDRLKWGNQTPVIQRDPAQLIDEAITNRRTLINQGIDPDKPALYVSPKRRAELLRENLALGQEQLEERRTNSIAATHAYKQKKDIDTADEVHSFFTGMTAIDKLPEGSSEKAKAFYEHVANHPLAFSTSGVKDFVKTYAGVHDSAAQLKGKRIEDAQYNTTWQQAFKEASLYGRTAGVDVQYNEEGFPSIEATRTHALKTKLTKLGLEPADLDQKWSTKVEGKTEMSFINKGDDKNPNWITIPTADLNELRNENRLASTKANGSATPTEDKYVAGKQYKDKDGNTATYLGGGKWQ